MLCTIINNNKTIDKNKIKISNGKVVYGDKSLYLQTPKFNIIKFDNNSISLSFKDSMFLSVISFIDLLCNNTVNPTRKIGPNGEFNVIKFPLNQNIKYYDNEGELISQPESIYEGLTGKSIIYPINITSSSDSNLWIISQLKLEYPNDIIDIDFDKCMLGLDLNKESISEWNDNYEYFESI